MKKTVYKYAVGDGPFELEMPKGAQILSVHTQKGVPQLWALVNPDAPKVTRRFLLCGTGHTLEKDSHDRWDFIGTFLVHGDSLVFHLFEIHPLLTPMVTKAHDDADFEPSMHGGSQQ